MEQGQIKTGFECDGCGNAGLSCPVLVAVCWRLVSCLGRLVVFVRSLERDWKGQCQGKGSSEAVLATQCRVGVRGSSGRKRVQTLVRVCERRELYVVMCYRYTILKLSWLLPICSVPSPEHEVEPTRW